MSVVALVAMGSLSTHASADDAFRPVGPAVVAIANDLGGFLVPYVRAWEYIASVGSRVEISGFCISACTAVLGLVPADRVCVHAGATFGFHSVSVNYGAHSPDGTRYLWSLYPEHVQDTLRKAGWDGSAGAQHDLFTISGAVFYPLCERAFDLEPYAALGPSHPTAR